MKLLLTFFIKNYAKNFIPNKKYITDKSFFNYINIINRFIFLSYISRPDIAYVIIL